MQGIWAFNISQASKLVAPDWAHFAVGQLASTKTAEYLFNKAHTNESTNYDKMNNNNDDNDNDNNTCLSFPGHSV